MKLPPSSYGAQPSDDVSPAPVGNVRFVAKRRGTNLRVVVSAHSWQLARDVAARDLGCDRYEIDASLEKEERKAAVAYVERADGRVLSVWNRRYGGFSLPGGKVEEGESIDAACVRELSEETGMAATKVEHVFDAPPCVAVEEDRGRHVHVFRVEAFGEAVESEPGCPVTWFTREEFLKWTPFKAFYEAMFAAVPPRKSREKKR